MTRTGAAQKTSSRQVSELIKVALELADEPTSTLRRELRLLLSRQIGRDEAWLLAHGDACIPEADAQSFLSLAGRRCAGEPVAYLLKEREFFGRPFACDRRALIPRPETELLVEHALSLPLPSEAHILDIGAGTGCIATTLLCERPHWRATAIDLSVGALALARSNARSLGTIDRMRLVASDLTAAFEALSVADFDLIVSNPPYVPVGDARHLAKDVHDFEPHLALFDPSGLGVYEKLFPLLTEQQAPALFEIGFGQSEPLSRMARESGLVVETLIADLAGIPRVLHLESPRA